MSKRKRPEPQPSIPQSTPQLQNHQLPRPIVRYIASGLVALHFAGLIVALSANLAPSFLHGKLLNVLAPWHVTTAQDYILLPLDMNQADRLEAPATIEVAQRGAASRWRQLPLPQVRQTQEGLRTNRSRWPNLSRLLCWVNENEPDNELLPEFAAAAVRSATAREAARPGSVFQGFDSLQLLAIRFFRPHVLSFDEDLIVSQDKAELIADSLQGEVIYSASAVFDGQENLRLIPAQSPAMTAKPAGEKATSLRPEVAR